MAPEVGRIFEAGLERNGEAQGDRADPRRTHFEYFERDFAKLLPTLAARNGIISPSGALACRLLDAFDEYLDENPVRPITSENRSYFAFSGERPPEETFKSLGLEQIVVAKHL